MCDFQLHVQLACANDLVMVTLLAEHIRRRRITQAMFARLAGLDPPMVSLYARGKRRPGLAAALKMEKASAGEVPASYWAAFIVDGSAHG